MTSERRDDDVVSPNGAGPPLLRGGQVFSAEEALEIPQEILDHREKMVKAQKDRHQEIQERVKASGGYGEPTPVKDAGHFLDPPKGKKHLDWILEEIDPLADPLVDRLEKGR